MTSVFSRLYTFDMVLIGSTSLLGLGIQEYGELYPHALDGRSGFRRRTSPTFWHRRRASASWVSKAQMIHQLHRIAVFTIGVFIMAFGIAISVRANLGTSPIASFPTVLSFATPLSVGFYMILLNLVFFLLQVLILGRKFPLIQLVQLPITLAFGIFTDLGMYLTSWLDPQNYLMQWVWTLVGVLLVALGVYIETQPRLSYIPGDGIVFTLTLVVQNVPFGTVKMIFDWSLVIISVIASLILLDGLEGVREGTVFAAFAVGIVIRLISTIHKRIGGR